MNVDALSREQLSALLSAAQRFRQDHWLMVVVGYLHGLRASEVISIKRVDLKDGFLTVRRLKGSEVTVQPLLRSENPLLNERQALVDYAVKSGLIHPLFNFTRQTFWNILRRHGKSAGIPEHQCHPHILKHSCATHMIAAVGLPATQKWLGHVSGNSTLIYTRMSQAQASGFAQTALCT